MVDSDRILIGRCRRLIEERLSTKESLQWKQRDYEYLRKLIFRKTGILLSVSTFKRLWRDQQGLPHPSTLDALASFLDYGDWYQFKQENRGSISESGDPATAPVTVQTHRKSFGFLPSRNAIGISLAAAFLTLGLFLVRAVGIAFSLSADGFRMVIQIQSFVFNLQLILFP